MTMVILLIKPSSLHLTHLLLSSPHPSKTIPSAPFNLSASLSPLPLSLSSPMQTLSSRGLTHPTDKAQDVDPSLTEKLKVSLASSLVASKGCLAKVNDWIKKAAQGQPHQPSGNDAVREVAINCIQTMRRCFPSSRPLCEAFALAKGHETLLELSLSPPPPSPSSSAAILQPLALISLTGPSFSVIIPYLTHLPLPIHLITRSPLFIAFTSRPNRRCSSSSRHLLCPNRPPQPCKIPPRPFCRHRRSHQAPPHPHPHRPTLFLPLSVQRGCSAPLPGLGHHWGPLEVLRLPPTFQSLPTDDHVLPPQASASSPGIDLPVKAECDRQAAEATPLPSPPSPDPLLILGA